MQQDIVEACVVAVKAVEEQEGSGGEAVEEGIGAIAWGWAGPACEDSGKVSICESSTSVWTGYVWFCWLIYLFFLVNKFRVNWVLMFGLMVMVMVMVIW